MKPYLIILSILLICACDMPQRESVTPTYTKAQLFMKDFVKNNPQMKINDVKMADAIDSFIFQFENFIDTGGMSNTPMKLTSMSPIDNGYGNGYVMHFEISKFEPKNEVSENSHLDIFAITTKEDAEKYTQSDTVAYNIVKCEKAKRIPSGEIKLLTNDMMWTGGIQFGEDGVLGTEYDFGNYVIYSAEIKKAKM